MFFFTKMLNPKLHKNFFQFIKKKIISKSITLFCWLSVNQRRNCWLSSFTVYFPLTCPCIQRRVVFNQQKVTASILFLFMSQSVLEWGIKFLHCFWLAYIFVTKREKELLIKKYTRPFIFILYTLYPWRGAMYMLLCQ